MLQQPGSSAGGCDGINIERREVGWSRCCKAHPVSNQASGNAGFRMRSGADILGERCDFEVVLQEGGRYPVVKHILTGDENAAATVKIGADR